MVTKRDTTDETDRNNDPADTEAKQMQKLKKRKTKTMGTSEKV